jgi:hypothetical protein
MERDCSNSLAAHEVQPARQLWIRPTTGTARLQWCPCLQQLTASLSHLTYHLCCLQWPPPGLAFLYGQGSWEYSPQVCRCVLIYFRNMCRTHQPEETPALHLVHLCPQVSVVVGAMAGAWLARELWQEVAAILWPYQ